MIEREKYNPFPYDTVFFDADSMLFTIEGIDEMAKRKGVEALVLQATNALMGGAPDHDGKHFVARWQLVNPTPTDIHELSKIYAENITAGAREAIAELKRNGANVLVVSGGIKQALDPVLEEKLGIPRHHVFGIEILFNERGEFGGFDERIPLHKPDGKVHVVRHLLHEYPGKAVIVGDGGGELRVGEEVEGCTFVCFTGVVYREKVAAQAEFVYEAPSLHGLTDFLWQTKGSAMDLRQEMAV